MIVVQHPTLSHVVRSVEDKAVKEWEEAGWHRLADGDRADRVAEVTDAGDTAVIPATLCPTCGAVGDDPCVTASGNETSRHAARPDA